VQKAVLQAGNESLAKTDGKRICSGFEFISILKALVL